MLLNVIKFCVVFHCYGFELKESIKSLPQTPDAYSQCVPYYKFRTLHMGAHVEIYGCFV